jgi:hypothetical protein
MTTVQPSSTIVTNDDPVQREVRTILRGLKHDLSLMGVLSLGKDGVLRSLTADRDVVDAIGLNPEQIVSIPNSIDIHKTYTAE